VTLPCATTLWPMSDCHGRLSRCANAIVSGIVDDAVTGEALITESFQLTLHVT
jgi:hypothetical protein